jgi:hypothetical protein
VLFFAAVELFLVVELFFDVAVVLVAAGSSFF